MIKCCLRPLSHLTLFDSLLEQVLALERVLAVVRDTPDVAARHTIIKCNTSIRCGTPASDEEQLTSTSQKCFKKSSRSSYKHRRNREGRTGERQRRVEIHKR
ncbi:hypothetical protein B0H13DRAFT_1037455 [Mycena leptocephala]|nr:hypothetical protein B0H13DRAFT_1037455 [Mycena leptocephala]